MVNDRTSIDVVLLLENIATRQGGCHNRLDQVTSVSVRLVLDAAERRFQVFESNGALINFIVHLTEAISRVDARQLVAGKFAHQAALSNPVVW